MLDDIYGGARATVICAADKRRLTTRVAAYAPAPGGGTTDACFVCTVHAYGISTSVRALARLLDLVVYIRTIG
jgi:hypothetical protein